MIKAMTFCITMALLIGISTSVLADPNAINGMPNLDNTPKIGTSPQHPDDVISRVMKKTVVMLLDDKPFCSGVIANDPEGQKHVYTAAHCCVIYLKTGMPGVALTSNNKKIDLLPLTQYSFSPVSDACKLDIKDGQGITTKIKIAPIKESRELFGVSAFPYYSPSERVPRIFVMGKTFDNPNHLVVSTQVHPGMSGSPVINLRGDVVGFMIAHFPRAPYPNGIISIMDTTGFLGNISPETFKQINTVPRIIK